jgi:hypothetical protein
MQPVTMTLPFCAMAADGLQRLRLGAVEEAAGVDNVTAPHASA